MPVALCSKPREPVMSPTNERGWFPVSEPAIGSGRSVSACICLGVCVERGMGWDELRVRACRFSIWTVRTENSLLRISGGRLAVVR